MTGETLKMKKTLKRLLWLAVLINLPQVSPFIFPQFPDTAVQDLLKAIPEAKDLIFPTLLQWANVKLFHKTNTDSKTGGKDTTSDKKTSDITKNVTEATKSVSTTTPPNETRKKKPKGIQYQLWPEHTVLYSDVEWPRTKGTKGVSKDALFRFKSRNLAGDLKDAMNDIESISCIKFRKIPRRARKPHLRIIPENKKDRGCEATVGYNATGPMWIKATLCNHRVLRTQLLHVLGLQLEHRRADRDRYVKILWENVIPEKRYTFEINEPVYTQELKLPYDYFSVLHFSDHALSVNGKPTLEPTRDLGVLTAFMGQKNHLSTNDILKINKIYKCPQTYMNK